MTTRPTHPAQQVACAVARAGWPVIPMRIDTDEKAPCVPWKRDPSKVCRTESDVIDNWPAHWPRWAAICGVPRPSDGRALVPLDADSREAADIASQLLPNHTRVRTGRPASGTHTWVSIPTTGTFTGRDGTPTSWRVLLYRFALRAANDLDWRGGDCIALLPGSVWAPRSHPGITYVHEVGHPLPDVIDLPVHLAAVFAGRAPATRSDTWLTGRRESGRVAPGPVDLTTRGAYERFLDAADRHGAQVRRTVRAGDAYVQCPGRGHPDGNRNRPMLHVTAGPGGVGLFCFGGHGCTKAEITAAFGMTEFDLFDDLGIRVADITVTDDTDKEHS